MNYSIVYSVVDLNITCGIMATFSNLYAAKKYKEFADKALRDSGLVGAIELVTHENGIVIEDPVQFFNEEVLAA